jgi:GAF domain-containing protein
MLTVMSEDGQRAALDRLTRLASRLLDVPISLVTVVEADRQVFAGMTGLAEPYATTRETPLSYSFCRHVVAARAPVRIPDARTDPLVADNPAVAEFDVGAYLGVPLAGPDGTILGSLCAIDHVPRAWSDEDRAALEDLCASVATELHLRAMLERERRWAMDLNDDLVQHLAAAKLQLQLDGAEGEVVDHVGAALQRAQATAAAMLERAGDILPGTLRRELE